VFLLICSSAQSVQRFDAEAVGASAISSLALFVPTTEEAVKVTAYVLKKHTAAVQLLQDQKRKEAEQAAAAHGGGGGESEAAAAAAAAGGGGEKEKRRRSSVASRKSSISGGGKGKLPLVAADIDEKALAKLKLGKAEQFIFVFAQVRRLFFARIGLISIGLRSAGCTMLSLFDCLFDILNWFKLMCCVWAL
jgi:hypothetical protein